MILSGATAPTIPAILRFVVNFFFPDLAYNLDLNAFDPQNLQFFIDTISESVTLRVQSGERRNDFIDLLRDSMAEMEEEKQRKIYSENDVQVQEGINSPEKIIVSHRIFIIRLKSLSSVLLISRYILGLGQRGCCCFCAACPNRKMYLEIRSANKGALRGSSVRILFFLIHSIFHLASKAVKRIRGCVQILSKTLLMASKIARTNQGT